VTLEPGLLAAKSSGRTFRSPRSCVSLRQCEWANENGLRLMPAPAHMPKLAVKVDRPAALSPANAKDSRLIRRRTRPRKLRIKRSSERSQPEATSLPPRLGHFHRKTMYELGGGDSEASAVELPWTIAVDHRLPDFRSGDLI
jgi:hypothetical protein